MRMPYTDTAVSPPKRTKIRFIKMEVIRPATLFKKLGLPQATICRTIFQENRGLRNRSTAFPRRKGISASSAQTNIPEQVAKAAAQTPQPSTAKKRNSSTALSTDMKILSSILPRMYPQMRRKLSMAKTMVVTGEQRAYTRI